MKSSKAQHYFFNQYFGIHCFYSRNILLIYLIAMDDVSCGSHILDDFELIVIDYIFIESCT